MFEWGIGIFSLHDSDGRALQANRAGPNWPNPSSPFLLMSTGNTKAPYHLDRVRKNADPPLRSGHCELTFESFFLILLDLICFDNERSKC